MISKIYKIIVAVLGILLIGSIIFGVCYFVSSNNWKEKWKTENANVLAFSDQLRGAKDDIAVYQLTIDQMRYYGDSTMQEMVRVIDSLKLKAKNVQQVQYIETIVERHDTLKMKDTLFLEPELCMDTLVGDRWAQAKLHLEYPSTIGIFQSFTSEKICVISLKRETINPPKKTWIGRLFQRKHKVARVNIVEKNPYVTDQNSTFVQTIK